MQEPMLNRISAEEREFIVAILTQFIDIGDGGTEEQRRVLVAFSNNFLGVDTRECTSKALKSNLGQSMLPETQRRCLQLAMMLEICRHPKSPQQHSKLEKMATEFNFNGDELEVCRSLINSSVEDATGDFIRRYRTHFPALLENYNNKQKLNKGEEVYGDIFFTRLESFQHMPNGSLGREFFEFYKRNGMKLPSATSINPGYYVAHDMNHVIAGYEPTGIGEICLGAFKLAMNDNDANWMASLTNFLIHEAGLFKPGKNAQYEAYGADGDPFDGLDGKRGVMTIPGADQMLADALKRGSQCNADFSSIDHLSVAELPLGEIRKSFNVIPPLRQIADESLNW